MNNQNNSVNEKNIVHEPEVLDPEPGYAGSDKSSSYSDNRSYNTSRRMWRVVNYSSDSSGCLAPAVTLALFLVCVGQFGLLAGTGFIFFHIIIAIMGSISATRKLVSGMYFNLWGWRLCNWTISFLLVYWLAGGLS